MTSYEHIYEVLNGGSGKEWIGEHLDELTVDQRIGAAHVVALAAIAEELSSISQHGIAQSGQISPAEEPPRSAYDDNDLTVL